ncbi:MAG: DUF2993 domain-containing protein [Fimbriimonas sp.]
MPSNDTLDVGEFTAHLREIVLPMGLRVDDVRIHGVGLHLERTPFSARLQAPGRLEVFVSEASLAAFLEAQAPAGLRDFKVEARDGKLYVKAVKTVIVAIPATAVCALRIEDRRRLMVDLESVEVAGGTSIKTLVQNQLDRINPIVDAADLPMVQATLDEVRMERGGVILTGQVQP